MASSLLAQFNQKLAERKNWEAANPAMAAAWTEALAMDAVFEREREARQSDLSIRDRLPDVLRRVGVPLDCIDGLRNCTKTPGLEAAGRFVAASAAEARFCVLYGPRGVGKTFAGVWALRELLVRHMTDQRPSGGIPAEPAMFVLASTFARLSGYNRDDREWFERMCDCGVLMLDDLGAEAQNQFSATMLDELLTRRHAARLRTIVTSNLDRDALAKRLGERLYDRIRTSCVAAQCVGESLRKRGVA
jgi:hypothetical protein